MNDDLTRRLRAADPAAALPPAGPERVARLLEDTMDDRTSPTETTPTRRSPVPWLAAAAAIALVAVLGIWTLGDGEPSPTANAPTSAPTSDASSPTASPTTSAASPTGDTTTTLTAPADGESGRCLPPTAAYLADVPTAFDGEVVALEDGLATIVVNEWYAGDPTDRVVVRAPSQNMQALIAAVNFEEGGRYLVAAAESGFVLVCGFSAPYDEGLAAMYADAFGG